MRLATVQRVLLVFKNFFLDLLGLLGDLLQLAFLVGGELAGGLLFLGEGVLQLGVVGFDVLVDLVQLPAVSVCFLL